MNTFTNKNAVKHVIASLMRLLESDNESVAANEFRKTIRYPFNDEVEMSETYSQVWDELANLL